MRSINEEEHGLDDCMEQLQRMGFLQFEKREDSEDAMYHVKLGKCFCSLDETAAKWGLSPDEYRKLFADRYGIDADEWHLGLKEIFDKGDTDGN